MAQYTMTFVNYLCSIYTGLKFTCLLYTFFIVPAAHTVMFSIVNIT